MIDTSVIYQHPRGPPFKASLKWLAQKWLKKEIQTKTGEEGGHDSEEDARTAIELVKLKMDKGESSASLLSLSLYDAGYSIPYECASPPCAQVLDSASLSTIRRRSLSASVAGRTRRPLRLSTMARRDNGTARRRLLPSRARMTMRCDRRMGTSPRSKPLIDSLLAQREQILQGLLDSVESHDLTIGRFMELSHTLACRSRPLPSLIPVTCAP